MEAMVQADFICEDVSVEVDKLLERSVLGGLKQTKIRSTLHFGMLIRNRGQCLPKLMRLPDNNYKFVEL